MPLRNLLKPLPHPPDPRKASQRIPNLEPVDTLTIAIGVMIMALILGTLGIIAYVISHMPIVAVGDDGKTVIRMTPTVLVTTLLTFVGFYTMKLMDIFRDRANRRFYQAEFEKTRHDLKGDYQAVNANVQLFHQELEKVTNGRLEEVVQEKAKEVAEKTTKQVLGPELSKEFSDLMAKVVQESRSISHRHMAQLMEMNRKEVAKLFEEHCGKLIRDQS